MGVNVDDHLGLLRSIANRINNSAFALLINFEFLLNKDWGNFQPESCMISGTKQKRKRGQKNNSQLGFASWPLRRRTDEEIIRLCANGLLQYPCQNQKED
jgi:hypothetical protein